MKRVLIITYYWPPAGGGGVMRWLKMSKYLPEWGWQPVICTPENPDPSVIDESLLQEVPPEAEILKVPIWEPYDLYRRQDAIGTPYCITVDHQTPADNTVTIRYQDSVEQEQIPIDQIREIVAEKVIMKNLFVKIK